VKLAAALIALVPVVALADTAPDEEGFMVERDNVEIAPAKTVHLGAVDLDNRLGDIVVIGRDQPGVSLAVVKRAPDEATLDRLKVNLIPDPEAGVIRISTALLIGTEARPIAAGQVRVDIKVYAPREVAVQARAWNGKVGVTGMEAGATLLAHDGDIVVSNVKGPVTTTSTRGRQSLTGVSGVVSADDTYGDLALEQISGAALAARVHRGNVTATRVRSQMVSITTTWGDIEFRGELLAGGRYELRSFHGNVLMHGGVAAARVEAWSRDGEVQPEAGLSGLTRTRDGRLMGSFGSGDTPAVLLMSSTAGRVIFGLTALP
jgi:Putative adhesin